DGRSTGETHPGVQLGGYLPAIADQRLLRTVTRFQAGVAPAEYALLAGRMPAGFASSAPRSPAAVAGRRPPRPDPGARAVIRGPPGVQLAAGHRRAPPAAGVARVRGRACLGLGSPTAKTS